MIYIAFPIFKSYALNSYAVHKLFVAECLNRLLPNPFVMVGAPSTAEVTVTKQEGCHVARIPHYHGERRTKDLDIIEDIIPLVNITAQLCLAYPPNQVYLAPQRQKLECGYDRGYARVTLPEVRGHQMAVFD